MNFFPKFSQVDDGEKILEGQIYSSVTPSCAKYGPTEDIDERTSHISEMNTQVGNIYFGHIAQIISISITSPRFLFLRSDVSDMS